MWLLSSSESKLLTSDVTTPVNISLSGPSGTSVVDFGGSAVPGHHLDATVLILSRSDVDISVVLQGDSRPDAGWIVPLTVKFFIPGTTAPTDVLTAAPVYSFDLVTAKSGGTAFVQAAGITAVFMISAWSLLIV